MCGISGIIDDNLNSSLKILKILEKYVGSKGYYQYSITHNVDEETARKGFGTGFMWMNKEGEIDYIKRNTLIEDLKVPIKKRCKAFIFFVGHTRWPSRGAPIGEARFTHPFVDCSKNVFVVHNGGFANYKEEYRKLKLKGHRFESEYRDLVVDSELIPHLIEEQLRDMKINCRSVVASIRYVLEKIVELSVDGKPGNFVVLIRKFPYLILAQERMTSGSRFKVWKKNGKLLFSTYKDIKEAEEGLKILPDLNIEQLVEMNKKLDEIMAKLGYTPIRILKPGEIVLISEDREIKTYRVKH